MWRVCKGIFVMVLVAGLGFVATGCGGDEPERASGIEIPEGPRDPGGERPGSGDDEPETDPGIAGTWSDKSGETVLTFDDSGTFEGNAGPRLGFHCQKPAQVSGSYTYDSLKSWLWLNVQGEGEVYVLEFKCLIDGDSMTLTDAGGKQTVLSRER